MTASTTAATAGGMRHVLLLLPLLALPAIAMAQDANRAASPMLVGQPEAATNTAATSPAVAPAIPAPLPPSFPDWAVTKAGENTTGQAPVGPLVNPANPATPSSVGTPASPVPGSPKSPTAPAVISKLWPRDTVRIFMPACTNFHPELVPACTCVITRLMVAMPHDEFLHESETDTIEKDQRLIAVREQCVTTPRRQDD